MSCFASAFFVVFSSTPCFSCEQLFCAPVVAWQRQVSPQSQNLCKALLKHENKILYTLPQRNAIDKPQYSTCFGSHWSNQDGRLPRTYNLYIVHKCTLYNYCTGCLFYLFLPIFSTKIKQLAKPMRSCFILKFYWQKSSGWLQLVFFSFWF